MTNNEQTKYHGGYDPFLLLSTLLLMGIGVVMVYSASSIVAMTRFGSDTYFFKRQVVHALIAILVLICCRNVPYSLYKTWAYPIVVVAFLSLLALYLPGVGHSVGGAKRWIRVFGMSFQPSEFARLGLIIYLAYSMSKKQENIKAFTIGFVPHAILLACFTTLIVMEPDLGMASVIIDGDSRLVFDSALDIVHVYVLTKNVAGIAVGGRDRRAGVTDKGGVGQGIAHVLGQAIDLVDAVFSLDKANLEAILGTVGFIHNKDDVAPLGQ